jgi:hypothetical protein
MGLFLFADSQRSMTAVGQRSTPTFRRQAQGSDRSLLFQEHHARLALPMSCIDDDNHETALTIPLSA